MRSLNMLRSRGNSQKRAGQSKGQEIELVEIAAVDFDETSFHEKMVRSLSVFLRVNDLG